MNTISKIILLSIGLLGCASNTKTRDSHYSINSFENKLVSLYREIKDESYLNNIYRNNHTDKYLDIKKLHNKYLIDYGSFRKYIYSLDPKLSYDEYKSNLESKVNKQGIRSRGITYEAPRILRRSGVKELIKESISNKSMFRDPAFEKFYTMLRLNNDLVEYKIEFKINDKSASADNYENKILIYLYKSINGKEFIIDPDVLVSTNF